MSGSDGRCWLEQLKLYSAPQRKAVTASEDGHATSHMQFPHSASPKSIIIFYCSDQSMQFLKSFPNVNEIE